MPPSSEKSFLFQDVSEGGAGRREGNSLSGRTPTSTARHFHYSFSCPATLVLAPTPVKSSLILRRLGLEHLQLEPRKTVTRLSCSIAPSKLDSNAEMHFPSESLSSQPETQLPLPIAKGFPSKTDSSTCVQTLIRFPWHGTTKCK